MNDPAYNLMYRLFVPWPGQARNETIAKTGAQRLSVTVKEDVVIVDDFPAVARFMVLTYEDVNPGTACKWHIDRPMLYCEDGQPDFAQTWDELVKGFAALADRLKKNGMQLPEMTL